MKIISHIIKFLKITLSSVFLGACIASPVFADDIEIYTSLGPSAITSNPNIMFLVDTSGSMNTESRVKDRYDASGPPYAGICDPTVIYFTKSGFPDCTTSKDYFDVTANTCDHSVVGYTIAGNKVTPAQDGSLLLVGTYSDQFAQYDPVSKGNFGRSKGTAA